MHHKILNSDVFVDGPTGCFASSSDELKLLALNSFNFDSYKPSFDEYKTTAITFCVDLSNACNLSCNYCFNPNKDGSSIPVDDVTKFLDECFVMFPNKEKYFVDLSGKGEPLLYLNNILEIKKHCDEWSNKLKREILVQFVTNGTLLIKETADILQKHGILFGVSLDGNEIIHDRHRKDKNGNPTYKQIINNVLSMPNHEYVGAACTLTNDVFSLNDSLNELSKIFRTVSYKPARYCFQSFDIGSVNLWLESYDELVEELIRECTNNDLHRIKALLNGEDYLGKFIHRIILNQRTMLRCDAGLSRFALDMDGKIYTCPASFEKETFRIGSNFKINFGKSKQMFNYQINQNECLKCDFRHVCGGECQLERYLSNGINKAMCIYKSHLILLAMRFTLEICKNNDCAFKEIRDFCTEVDNRKRIDKELMRFLNGNPKYSFVEGKKIFDSYNKRY